MSYAVLIDHEISELAATELVAELAAELAASFTLVYLASSSTAIYVWICVKWSTEYLA